MNGITPETDWLDQCEKHPELDRIFEKHGVSWLLDLSGTVQCDRLVEDATAICGLKPGELRAELSEALHTPPPRMVRRIPH